VASIRAFLKPSDGVFDDHATRILGEAFEAARKKLHSAGRPHIVLKPSPRGLSLRQAKANAIQFDCATPD
jgi:hypothetical protein